VAAVIPSEQLTAMQIGLGWKFHERGPRLCCAAQSLQQMIQECARLVSRHALN
jgi:hypothetical protein